MTRSARILLCLIGLAMSQANLVGASAYKVTPVRLSLSRANSRTLLTLKNESKEMLRFQVTVSAWEEGSQDEVALRPTEDILLFPSVLSVAPNEERTLRVASLIRFDSVEKTYRILFEELPPLADPNAPRDSQIRILTRMSVPVFLEPASIIAESRVEATLERGALSLHLHNLGNVHTLVREIRVQGLGENGEAVLARTLKGWYVLAGASRTYRVEIPQEECSKARRIAVEIETDRRTIVGSLDTQPGACALSGEVSLQAVLAQ